MTIRQGRYIVAETEQEKKVRVTEIQRAEEDPFIRRSEVQQTVNNSTLPVSSRAVNLAIESVNSNLNLKADKTELEGLATEDYVNEKIDEKEVGITEPELISKSVGSDKWLREGAYGVGGHAVNTHADEADPNISGFFAGKGSSGTVFKYMPFIQVSRSGTRVMQLGMETPSAGMRYRVSDSGSWQPIRSLLDDANTYPDSNGVLHNSRNPIDTLNTSDMADTVVDNDLLTVTSGAVFRAIKQLTDQITSLEARVRELEDGGV